MNVTIIIVMMIAAFFIMFFILLAVMIYQNMTVNEVINITAEVGEVRKRVITHS